MLLLLAVLLYRLLCDVKQGPARCQKIPLDGKQSIGPVEVHSEPGRSHVTRRKIPVVCGSINDGDEMVVAELLCCHQLCGVI